MALRRPILPSRLTGAPVPDVMPSSANSANTPTTAASAAAPVATPAPVTSAAPAAASVAAPVAAPATPAATAQVSSAELAAAAASAFADFPVAAPRVLEDSFANTAPKGGATAATVSVTPAVAAPATPVAPTTAVVAPAAPSAAKPVPAPGSMAAQAAAAAASKAGATSTSTSPAAPAMPAPAAAVATQAVSTPANVASVPVVAPIVATPAPAPTPPAVKTASAAPATVPAAPAAASAGAANTVPAPSLPSDPMRRKVRAKQPRDFNAIVAPAAPAAPAPVTGAQTNFAKGVPVDTKPISQVQAELIATGIIAPTPADSLTSQLPTGLTEEVLATPVVPVPPQPAPAPVPPVNSPSSAVAAPVKAPVPAPEITATATPAPPKPLPQATPRPAPQPITPAAPTRPTAPVPAPGVGTNSATNRTATAPSANTPAAPVNPAPSVAAAPLVATAATVATANPATAASAPASMPANPAPEPISPLAIVPPSPAESASQARPAAQAPANALSKSANKNNNQTAAYNSQWNVPEAAAEWELEPMHNPGWATAEPAAAQAPSQLPPPGDVYRPQLGNAAGQWPTSPVAPPQLPTARHSGPAGRALPSQGTPWGMLLAGLAITGGVAWLVYQPTGGSSGMAQLAKLTTPAAPATQVAAQPSNEIGLLPPPELNAPAAPNTSTAKIDFTEVPPAEQNKPIMAAGNENMPKDVSIFAQVQEEIAAARARKDGVAPSHNSAGNLPPPADLTPEKLQEELSAYRRTLANAESASAAPKPSQFRQDPAAYMDGQNNARNSSALGAAGAEGAVAPTDTAALLPPPELYLNNPKNLPVVAEPQAEAAARVRELSEFNVEPFTPERERVQIPAGLKPRLAATDFPGLEVLSFVPDKGIVAFADGREGVLLIGESINGWELTSVNPDRAEFKAGEKTYQLSAQ